VAPYVRKRQPATAASKSTWWLLRTNTGSLVDGADTAALLLAADVNLANGGADPTRRRRQSVASPARTGSHRRVGRRDSCRSGPVMSRTRPTACRASATLVAVGQATQEDGASIGSRDNTRGNVAWAAVTGIRRDPGPNLARSSHHPRDMEYSNGLPDNHLEGACQRPCRSVAGRSSNSQVCSEIMRTPASERSAGAERRVYGRRVSS
jgi:hypothetical protein